MGISKSGGDTSIFSYLPQPELGGVWEPAGDAKASGFPPVLIMYADKTCVIGLSCVDDNFLVGSLQTFLDNYRYSHADMERYQQALSDSHLRWRLNGFIASAGGLTKSYRKTVVVGWKRK